MDAARGRPSWNIANLESPFQTAILVSGVAILCYLAAKLGHALVIPPDHTAAFWPATPLLVAILLLVPRRIWPGLIAAGFGAMVVSDLQNGVPLNSLIWFTLCDAVGVLIAALGVSHLFNGPPHLDTAKALAKYFLFVVTLAFASALVGANAPERGSTYWLQTKLWFLSDSIAYLTVTPAVLSWVGGRAWARKSRGYYLEAAALILALTVFGYLAFAAPGGSTPPVLLYLPVPFLLWAALRFGSFGVANSVVVIALLSIWGAAHGRGPFTEPTPLNNVLSLQLFLFFTAASSMFLAVLVEEHKRAQEKLRESEERLRLAAEAGKMFAFEWDAVTDVIVRSGESGRILDIDEATSGQQVWAQVHPDDRETLTAAVAVLTADNSQFQVSHRMVRPDGTVIWVERNCRAHFDKQGKLLRIVGMVVDVTQHKRVEEALKDSEDRLRLAVKAGRMYAFEWDARTDIVVRSGECADIFNWMDDPTRDTGRNFIACVHSDDREWYRNLEAGLPPENSTYSGSYRMLRPDGSVIWLEERGHALFDEKGKLRRVIGMVSDVTERKQAEVALSESEERFRRVANTAPVLIWMSDADKLCNYLNQGWLDFTGRSLESELKNGWAEGIHPDDQKSCVDAFHEAFEQRKEFEIEYRLRRNDGEYRWMLDRGVPRFNADNSFAGYIGTCIDVTDHKLAEQALSSVSRRLIDAHEEERTRIARELHDDISQKVAMLAVELDQLAQNAPESTAEASSRIRGTRARVSDLEADIRALSHRLHSSKLEHLGIAAAAAGFCRELATQQRVEIDFDCAGVPQNLPREVSLCLFRVLQEGLHNAVKHSGVRHFKVELGAAENEIRLVVSDSGLGFDPEAAMSGSGLGLISMRERVHLVGGEISIESQANRGTNVRVRVPARPVQHFVKAAG